MMTTVGASAGQLTSDDIPPPIPVYNPNNTEYSVLKREDKEVNNWVKTLMYTLLAIINRSKNNWTFNTNRQLVHCIQH